MPSARYVPTARERTVWAWGAGIYISVLSTAFAVGKYKGNKGILSASCLHEGGGYSFFDKCLYHATVSCLICNVMNRYLLALVQKLLK